LSYPFKAGDKGVKGDGILRRRLEEVMVSYLGKILVGIGLIFVIIGATLLLSKHIPFIGRLPGDIYIRKENFSLYLPLGTCLLLSITLSIILAVLSWFWKR